MLNLLTSPDVVVV